LLCIFSWCILVGYVRYCSYTVVGAGPCRTYLTLQGTLHAPLADYLCPRGEGLGLLVWPSRISSYPLPDSIQVPKPKPAAEHKEEPKAVEAGKKPDDPNAESVAVGEAAKAQVSGSACCAVD
jgi:hypothetical protein